MIQAPQMQYLPALQQMTQNGQQPGASSVIPYQTQTSGVIYNYPTSSCYSNPNNNSNGKSQFNGVNIEINNPQGQNNSPNANAMPANFVQMPAVTTFYPQGNAMPNAFPQMPAMNVNPYAMPMAPAPQMPYAQPVVQTPTFAQTGYMTQQMPAYGPVAQGTPAAQAVVNGPVIQMPVAEPAPQVVTPAVAQAPATPVAPVVVEAAPQAPVAPVAPVVVEQQAPAAPVAPVVVQAQPQVQPQVQVQTQPQVQVQPQVQPQPAPAPVEVAAPVNTVDVSGVDANLTPQAFAARLKTDNLDEQVKVMEEIATAVKNDEKLGPILLDTQVFEALVDIANKDTSALQGPTKEITALRNKPQNKLSAEQLALAQTATPLEKAEINKTYALYTIGFMQERLNKELEARKGMTLELKDLPCIETVVEAVKSNPNPMVRKSAISALKYIAKPQYADDLKTIFNLAKADSNKEVKEAATKALQDLK